MPNITKTQIAKWQKLDRDLNIAVKAVFNVVHPRNDIVFSECYKQAPNDIKTAYDNARRAKADFEYEMISQGRAYRSPNGLFLTNGHGMIY